jgi:type I restriction enzyme, S subunit
MGWTLAKIGSITTCPEQRQPLPDEQFFYIDISSIDRETKQIVSPQQLSGNTAPTRARQVVKSGDVLVSMTRPNLNAVALVPDELDSNIASTGFDVLRPIEVESRWLFNIVRSGGFVAAMSALVQGALYPAVRPRDIRGYEIPLAPLNEQKRIADKLDTFLARVDACRQRLARVQQILTQFRQAVLGAATSGALTEEWASEQKWGISPLGTLLADIRYGTARKSVYDLTGGTPVIRIPNIVNGRVDLTDLKYGHFNQKEIDTLSLKIGDLLIIRSNGSLDLVGKAAVVGPEAQGHLFAGYLIRLRVKTSLIDPRYLCFYLSSPDIRRHIELTARSTSGVNNINSEEIRDIKINLPGLDEQLEIIRRVEILLGLADRLETRYIAGRDQVESLTPALLDKAFRGELVSQNPKDEPAEKLLKRISSTINEQKSRPRSNINLTKRKKIVMKTKPASDLSELLEVLNSLEGMAMPERLLAESGLADNVDLFFELLREGRDRHILEVPVGLNGPIRVKHNAHR